MRLWITLSVCFALFLSGCAAKGGIDALYYDIEGVSYCPGGVSAALARPDTQDENGLIVAIGNFSESSIEIAHHRALDTPLVIEWRCQRNDYVRPFPFQLLPPLDTANQKYHIRFTFYPGDSVRVQARAVAKSDCRHTIRHGATALAGSGPCVSDHGYSNALDSAIRGLVLYPESGPLEFPEK